MKPDVQSNTMFQLRLPDRARYVILILTVTISVAGGLAVHGLSLAAVHFAILPAFICYALTVRPDLAHRLRPCHVLYVILLAAMVSGYLLLLAKAIPQLRICWAEVPIAVWFLLNMHVMVGLMDRLVQAGSSAIFGLIGRRVRTVSPGHFRIAQVLLRGLCILVVAGPYILAMFAAHWVKFADNGDPMSQCGVAFEHVRIQAMDGVSLDGWFIPAAATSESLEAPSDATIMVVPGRGMPKGCSLNYAQILYLSGYNVLLFDLRGEGSSAGHSRSFGVRETQDVLGAVRYLEQTHAESSRHIYALGISQGASAVIRAAAADERIRAVVVDSALSIANDVLPRRMLRRLPAPCAGTSGI